MRIKHPNGATGVSHDGKSYVADGNGIIDVPDEAAKVLAGHGFVEAPEEVRTYAKPNKKSKGGDTPASD